MTGQEQQIFEPDQVRQAALLEEMQTQRGFLGDRAVNLAADLAIKNVELSQAMARIAALEKERDEWKSKAESNQGELALEVPAPSGGVR